MAAKKKPAKRSPDAAPAPDPGMNPWDREETPLEQLPPLEYPTATLQGATEASEERRRRRIRVELYGGLALVVLGIVASFALRAPAPLLIALLTVGGLAAYEVLVTSFE